MRITKLFLLIILVSSSCFADWKESFYTDDSNYFLQLKSDGFKLRFRVARNDCSSIVTAKILFKHSDSNQNNTEFKKMNSSTMQNKWPLLYGINYNNYCWYQANISQLDLNAVEKNKYVIEIQSRHSSTPYYYQGLMDSLLPSKRLSLGNIMKWISLGGHGSFKVEGGGVFFKIWEPFSDQVDLYIGNSRSAINLIPDFEHTDIRRSHSIYVKNAKLGHQYHYKFKKHGNYEVITTTNSGKRSAIKVDPMARQIVYKSKGGLINGYDTPKSIVTQNTNYRFYNDRFITSLSKEERDNWIIYQLWPAAFNPPKNGNRIGTFNDVKKKANYLENLGINTVEFLPVHEARFHASWGYALDSLLVLENNLGTPREFKALVDTLHGKKIRVILDVVLNHVNNTLIRDPLSASRNTSKFYDGDTGWGPKPNFKSIMVRKWMMDSMLALRREYHVDGYRFDMIEHIYSGSAAGYNFLKEVNLLLKIDNPYFYTTAEQLPDNVWVTYPIYKGGLGFDSQWNDNFKNAFEDGFSHYNKDNRSIEIDRLVSSLRGFSGHKRSDGGYYHFGPPLRSMNYIGSHDFVGNKDPIIRLVSGLRSYENDGHNKFFRVKPFSGPNAHQNFLTVHNDFTHGVGKLAYTILFTKPGPLLFFQGEEMANDRNIENEWSYINARQNNSMPSKNVNIKKYIKNHRVPWEHLNPDKSELNFISKELQHSFKGYHHFFKQLIYLKKNVPSINNSDIEDIKVYHNGTIIRYLVNAKNYQFLVILNIGNDQKGVWVDFPHQNVWWKELMNSSEHQYGGKNDQFTNIIPQKGGRANLIRLKSASSSIFMVKKLENLKKDLYLRGNFNGWRVNEKQKLLVSKRNQLYYQTSLTINKSSDYLFKLGSKNWDISLGKLRGNSFKGTLSYKVGAKDVPVYLEKGQYNFIFNIENFEYQFVKK